MNDISGVVDHAASQSDRWMFVAMTVVLLLAVLTFWRWIVGDREKVAMRLTEITDRHIQSGERLAEVVSKATTVMQEVRDTMQEVKHTIVFCRERKGP